MSGVSEGIKMRTEWEITRFVDPTGEITEFLRNGGTIEDAIKKYGKQFKGKESWIGNLGLNEGINNVLDLIAGLATPTKWDSANARLGVGDSNTAPVATQTGLQGTNKSWKGMDSTYPQRSNQTLEWRATWGASEGNYEWREYTVVNASDDTGQNLNRCLSDKGTKQSPESWTLSLKITLA